MRVTLRACAALLLAGLFLAPLPEGLGAGSTAFAQTFSPPGVPGPFGPYAAPPGRGGRGPGGGQAGGPVDGDAAVRMLAGRGFSDISVVRRRGPTIILEANGPRGERVQVVVDSNSGAISGMKVIGYGNKRY